MQYFRLQEYLDLEDMFRTKANDVSQQRFAWCSMFCSPPGRDFSIAADMKEMYRQILVVMPNADYQRIVWHVNSNSEVQLYRSLTIT